MVALLLWSIPSFALAEEARPIGTQSFDCLASADQTVKVSTAVSGLISEILVDQGDRVQKGQVLAALESSVEQAEFEMAKIKASNGGPVDAARAQNDLAVAVAERYLKLKAANASGIAGSQIQEAQAQARVTESQLRNAEKELEAAKLEADRSQALLERRKVRSPIDGIVVERLMNAGEHSYEQSNILTLAKIDPLEVVAYLPIEYYNQVEIGAPATVSLAAPFTSDRPADISFIDKVLHTGSGTFGVKLKMANPDWSISSGVRCTIRFETAKKG